MEVASWMICTATICFTSLTLFFFLRCGRLNRPPGPKPWPVIGNLNLIGPLPHITIHELSQKYGPMMQLYFGSVPIVVGSSVDTAKLFLKKHDLNFATRPSTAAGKYTSNDHSSPTWAPYGPYWRQARKIYHSLVFEMKQIDSFEHVRGEELQILLSDMYKKSGKPFCFEKYIKNFTLNNICRMVLGNKVDSSSITTPAELNEISDEWYHLNGVLNIGDFIPWINFLDLQGYVKQMKLFGKKFNHFLEHVIEEHVEKQRAVSKDFVPEDDMLDILLKHANDPKIELKLSRTQVRGLLQDLLLGGTETSGLTTIWAMSELLRNPEIIKRATEELDRVITKDRWVQDKDLPNLPYIEAIMKEAMRLHPLAPYLVPHVCREDCKIDGYDIVAGTRVLVNIWSIQRDPTLWDAPHEFRPERFIGSDIDVKGQNFKFLPFGSGRRMCPAYPLGVRLVHSGLANLLHGFNWNLPDDMKPQDLCMEEKYGLTVSRKVPLMVVAQPRLPTHLYSQ